MRILAEFRNADELVRMIAYFYHNAKKPSWIDEAVISRPFRSVCVKQIEPTV